MSNRPCKMSKRILAAIIDALMIVLLARLVLTLVMLTPIGTHLKETYDKYYELYSSYVLSLDLGTMISTNSTSSLSVFSNLNSTQISMFNSAIGNDSIYRSLGNTYLNTQLGIYLFSVFISEIIFLFLIPFFNKYYQTLGKMVCKVGVVDINYELPISKKSRVFRFIGSYLVETALVMFLFKNQIQMTMIFSILICLTLIMFSQNRQAIHDIFAKSKVVDLKTAVLFSSIEEKENYDAEILRKREEKNKDVIETEVVEEESGDFIASLTSIGPNRVEVINLIKEYTNLDNQGANSLVSELPVVIKEFLTEEKAKRIQDRFDSVGAIIEVWKDDFSEETSEELSKCSLFIEKVDPSRIKDVTLAIQDITSLPVTKARALINKLPALVVTDKEEEELLPYKEKLEASGAVVSIKS